MFKKVKSLFENLKYDIYQGSRKVSNIKVMSISCLFFSVMMAVFVLIDCIEGRIASIWLSAIMSIIFGTSAAICWFKKNRTVPGIMVTVSAAFLCTVYTIEGSSEGFSILWTTLLPITIMYFVSVRLGLCLSLYFEFLFMLCFYSPVKSIITGYSPLFMSRYPILYFCIIVIDSIAMIQYHNSTLAGFAAESRLNEEVEKQTHKANARSEQISEMSLQMIQTLANAIDAKDAYTKDHSYRVSKYSACLAKALGWSDRRINRLRYDALIHDIGKIGVPDGVLNKDGKLTDEEFTAVKEHTSAGFQIFEEATAFPTAKLVARHHHERYDGTGYPDNLKGDEIPENARIVCIADAFDAMSSDRIYRKALPMSVIRKELLDGAGKQFDPNFVKVFVELLDEDQLIV